MKNLLFDFNNLNDKARAVKKAVQAFGRVGANVVSSDVDKTTSRRSGITFRNVHFTFADGQTVTMGIKQSGDVFEVKLNGKLIPLRNQDDHGEAIKEVAAKMDAGRAAYQKALARVKVPLPPAARVSRATLIKTKEQRRDDLKVAVAEAEKTLQELQGGEALAPA